jgi:hypothetical protein
MSIHVTGAGHPRRSLLCSAAILLVLAAAAPGAASAQTQAAPPAAAAQAAPADAFTKAEIETLVAPYALYPDALLAQVLPASAYPVDIVQVSRWLAKNKASADKGDFATLDAQTWDPSVKALARFPTVIERLNADLDATTDLGDAFVNQPDDVAAVIQSLRLQAQKAGTLQSTPQQRVVVQAQDDVQYVVIEPTDPEVLYVPTYDPAVVYNPGANVAVAGLVGFGLGVAVGAAMDNPWDWRRGYVYPPRWAGYPGYRPGYGGVNVGGNVNIGNSVNIGNGATRPWRPDTDRYRPGQGSKPNIGGGAGNRTVRGGGNTVNIDKSTTNIGGGNRTNVSTGDRTAIGNGDRTKVTGGDRANVSGGDRTKINAGGDRTKVKSAGGDRTKVNAAVENRGGGAGKAVADRKPASVPQRPSAPVRDSAFGDAKFGGASNAMAQRGAASRQAVPRPGGGGGGAAIGGGGGPRGGGGGGGPRGGGGGGRGGGGGGGLHRR